MLSLMYLGGALLYLVLMFVVVRGAWRIGRRDNGSVWRGASFAAGGFLLVYLPVFWNQVPTALSFRNACERDAGFIAFVEPKGWIDSHQKLIQELRGIDPEATSRSQKTSSGASRYMYMGGFLQKRTASPNKKFTDYRWAGLSRRLLMRELGRYLHAQWTTR